jgi:hypothetical protein
VGPFLVANYREWLREPGCADCFFPRGVPFAYYRESGFQGGDGIVWLGLFGDIVICLMAAAFTAGYSTGFGGSSNQSRDFFSHTDWQAT